MANIKLGNKIFNNVEEVKVNTAEGEGVIFSLGSGCSGEFYTTLIHSYPSYITSEMAERLCTNKDLLLYYEITDTSEAKHKVYKGFAQGVVNKDGTVQYYDEDHKFLIEAIYYAPEDTYMAHVEKLTSSVACNYGMTLPDVRTVWYGRIKEKFPYACIRVTYSGDIELLLYDKQFNWESGNSAIGADWFNFRAYVDTQGVCLSYNSQTNRWGDESFVEYIHANLDNWEEYVAYAEDLILDREYNYMLWMSDNFERRLGLCNTCYADPVPVESLPGKLSYRWINFETEGELASIGTYTGTDVIIPDRNIGLPITSIGYNVFKDYTALNSVTIKNGISNIGTAAFSGCTGLTSIIIPTSITNISDNAFSGCTALARVYYRGTEIEWRNIEIDSTNKKLKSSQRYYFSEYQPLEEGSYWHYVDGVPTPW